MIELEHAWGNGRSHKYIAKIGNRYFYSQDEIRAFKEGAQKKAGNAFDTARKGALTVKKKVDSVPRIQKHGSKYYVADKKTQRKIEKSGAGGNTYYKKKDGSTEFTPAGRSRLRSMRYQEISKNLSKDISAQKRIINANKISGTPSTRTIKDKDGRVLYTTHDPTAKNVANKTMEKALNVAKSKTYEGASKGIEKKYSKYELGNVTKVNQGKEKVKQLTGDATKKVDNVADKFKKKAKDAKNDVVNAPDNAKKSVKKKINNIEIADGYKVKDAVRDKKEAEKFLADPEGYAKDYIQEKKRKKKNAQTQKIKKTLKANSNRTVKSHYGELNR